jgi:hypothetical protein
VPLFAWFTIPSLILVAFVVVVVASKPTAADGIATVLGALERVLKAITPWSPRDR